MKLGIGARYAHAKEPAQSLYFSQLISGLTERHLNPKTDQLYVYTGSKSKLQLSNIQFQHVHTIQSRFPIEKQSVGLLWEQTALPFHIAAHHLDIYHGPFFFLPLHLLNQKTKLVVTVDDLAFEKNPEHFTKRSLFYFKTIARKSAEKAHAIATISNSVKQDLINIYRIPEEKIHTTYLALNPIFQELAQKPLQAHVLTQLGLEKPFILVVGVIHPRKNPLAVAEAFAQIHHKYPHHELVFLGRKTYDAKNLMVTLQKNGIMRKVKFFSNLPLDVIVSIYKAAQCLIMPSHSEGFGFPALEALATVTPVIAANRGALPEVLGPCGIYFDPFKAEELAECLDSFLSHSYNKEPYEQLSKIQLAKFTWNSHCQETLKLYHSIL